MQNIDGVLVSPDDTIKEGIKALNSASVKLLFVVENGKLVGVTSDGDIRRRFIMGNKSLDQPISAIMTTEPIVVKGYNKKLAVQYMRNNKIDVVPVVDNDGRPLAAYTWEDLLEEPQKKEKGQVDIPVVIMAGGIGSRLRPLTNVLPKPLIPIGDKTIIERIIDSFRECGCQRFILTVNYKKNLIKAFFESCDVDYKLLFLEEETYLGTCGSISLLNKTISETFIISNCDILLEIDYADLVKTHREQKNMLTVVTCATKTEIPYGVFELSEDGTINQIVEKPKVSYNINTGVYVLEPEIIQMIPENTPYQMNDLIQLLLDSNKRVGAYLIGDKQWTDMGQFDHMSEMLNSLGTN